MEIQHPSFPFFVLQWPVLHTDEGASVSGWFAAWGLVVVSLVLAATQVACIWQESRRGLSWQLALKNKLANMCFTWHMTAYVKNILKYECCQVLMQLVLSIVDRWCLNMSMWVCVFFARLPGLWFHRNAGLALLGDDRKVIVDCQLSMHVNCCSMSLLSWWMSMWLSIVNATCVVNCWCNLSCQLLTGWCNLAASNSWLMTVDDHDLH